MNDWTLEELGQWLALRVKRAKLWVDPALKHKDLSDAQDTIDLMQKILNQEKQAASVYVYGNDKSSAGGAI